MENAQKSDGPNTDVKKSPINVSGQATDLDVDETSTYKKPPMWGPSTAKVRDQPWEFKDYTTDRTIDMTNVVFQDGDLHFYGIKNDEGGR